MVLPAAERAGVGIIELAGFRERSFGIVRIATTRFERVEDGFVAACVDERCLSAFNVRSARRHANLMFFDRFCETMKIRVVTAQFVG